MEEQFTSAADRLRNKMKNNIDVFQEKLIALEEQMRVAIQSKNTAFETMIQAKEKVHEVKLSYERKRQETGKLVLLEDEILVTQANHEFEIAKLKYDNVVKDLDLIIMMFTSVCRNHM